MSLEFEWFVNCFDKTYTLTSGKKYCKFESKYVEFFLNDKIIMM